MCELKLLLEINIGESVQWNNIEGEHGVNAEIAERNYDLNNDLVNDIYNSIIFSLIKI